MQKPDRIPVLFLDNTYTFGGAINSLSYLLRALDKTRFTPILVTAQPESFLRRNFAFVKWQHINIKLPWVHDRQYKRITAFRLFSSGFGLKCVSYMRFAYWLLFVTIPEAVRYYKIGREYKVRLVHLNNTFGRQHAGIIAAKMLKVPCVSHLRDFEPPDVVTCFFAKHVHRHIAISNAIRDNLLKLKVQEANIAIIHDAIDLDIFTDTVPYEYLREEFNIGGKEKLFGIFGRIIEWKGIKEFIAAAALVFESMENAKGFIVGDFSDGDSAYVDEVRELITRNGLDKHIILTGYRNDVPAIMQLMDVVVHASIKPEPFGMVLIEGMAMSKPIVATKMGGPLDIVVDGKTGFLVEPCDIKSMAQAVLRLLAEKSLAETMGHNGHERVDALFSKERYARQVEKVYMHELGIG